MTIYVLENCGPCDELKKWISENEDLKNKVFSFLRVEKRGDKYYCEDKIINNNIKVFPTIDFDGDYIFGINAIKQFLSKGYIHDIKFCPMLNKYCIENDCEMFSVINKGKIKEGHCSFVLNALLSLELVKTVSRS